MTRRRTWSAALLFILTLQLRPSDACAQLLPSWERIKLSDAVVGLKFGGDMRLRYDSSFKRGGASGAQNDRGRNRLRLRVATELAFKQNFTANLRLATGTGEQVSTNQSYDNLSAQKAINIDQAYAKWAPALSEMGSAYLQAGRMQNPLWRVYSSDLVWDDDFNPEGYAQGVEWLFPGAGLTVFANLMQAVADEDSNSSKNQWFFSQQAGVETRLPLESRLRLAAAYHKWSDEQRSTLSPNTTLDGNRRLANGILHNRFGVGEVTGQISSWLGQTPLALQATAIRNFRARGDLGDIAQACPNRGIDCPRASDGYQFGAIIGAAKMAGTWELAYFKKYAQTDATVADVADSDFGDGGTNQKGHILWGAYAPSDWMQLKVKYFIVDTIDRQFNPGDKAVNRIQADLSVKF